MMHKCMEKILNLSLSLSFSFVFYFRTISDDDKTKRKDEFFLFLRRSFSFACISPKISGISRKREFVYHFVFVFTSFVSFLLFCKCFPIFVAKDVLCVYAKAKKTKQKDWLLVWLAVCFVFVIFGHKNAFDIFRFHFWKSFWMLSLSLRMLLILCGFFFVLLLSLVHSRCGLSPIWCLYLAAVSAFNVTNCNKWFGCCTQT